MWALQFDKKISEEGQTTHRLKRCEYNNEDNDNIPNTVSDKENCNDRL